MDSLLDVPVVLDGHCPLSKKARLIFRDIKIHANSLTLGEILDYHLFMMHVPEIKEKIQGDIHCVLSDLVVDEELNRKQLSNLIYIYWAEIDVKKLVEKVEEKSPPRYKRIFSNRIKSLFTFKRIKGEIPSENYFLKTPDKYNVSSKVSSGLDLADLKKLQQDDELFRHLGPLNVSVHGPTANFMFSEHDIIPVSCVFCWTKIKDVKRSLKVPLKDGTWDGTFCSWECLALNLENMKNVNVPRLLEMKREFISRGIYVRERF